MRKAIFLDLDGTLIFTKSGKTFPVDMNDWKFNENIFPLLQAAKKRGFIFVIVSNQGGIQQGYVDKEEFEKKLEDIIYGLKDKLDCPLSNITFYYCDSNDSTNFYRKPNPGMAYKAALDFAILLNESIMIGDASGRPGQFSASDFNFARKAGFAKYYDISEVTENPEDILLYSTRKDKLPYHKEEERKKFFDDINGK